MAADLGRYFSKQALKRIEDIKENPIEPKTANESNALWDEIYKENKGIFLTHVVKPSTMQNQKFDIMIYLIKHQSEDLSEADYAEFFFGRMWHNKVYKINNDGGFVGLLASAYGEFLCTCRVTFKDGYQAYLQRYIDFESKS